MRIVADYILKAITLGVPVFLAACYGAPYQQASYSQRRVGKTIDKDTKAPIPGLRVSCVTIEDAGPQVTATASSGADGRFQLNAIEACNTIKVEDVDGAANGSYATKEVAPTSQDTDLTIEMSRTN